LTAPRNVPRAAENALVDLNSQARDRLDVQDEESENVVQVNVTSNTFEPRLQELSPGDTVRFNCQEGEHTATLYHPENDVERRSPIGAGVWDSGTLEEGETFEVTIDTPGVYDYFCKPHENQGMVGSLIVGDNDNPDQPGLSTPENVPTGAVNPLANLNSQARDRLGIDDAGSGNDGNNDDNLANQRLEVNVNSTFFNPAVDTVEAGGTVEFTVNQGTHTATLYHPDNGSDIPLRAPQGVDAWDSGTIEAGESFSVQLDEPGVYDYFCEFHRSLSMVGSIVVRGDGDDDPDQAGLSEPDDVPVQESADRLRELNDEAREILGISN
jgi:plastocyanin